MERALDRLACLDSVEESVALDVFTRTLELELESDLGRVGRMGEGVLVGSIDMGVGLDLDLVVVLGLAEGLCPSPTHDDSLLPDHEREAAGGELPLRSGARRTPAPPASCRTRRCFEPGALRAPWRPASQHRAGPLALDPADSESHRRRGVVVREAPRCRAAMAEARRLLRRRPCDGWTFPQARRSTACDPSWRKGTARLDSSSVDAVGDATLQAGAEVVAGTAQ